MTDFFNTYFLLPLLSHQKRRRRASHCSEQKFVLAEDISGVQAPNLAYIQAPAVSFASPVGIFLTSSCRVLVLLCFVFAIIPITAKCIKQSIFIWENGGTGYLPYSKINCSMVESHPPPFFLFSKN